MLFITLRISVVDLCMKLGTLSSALDNISYVVGRLKHDATRIFAATIATFCKEKEALFSRIKKQILIQSFDTSQL